MAGTSAGYREHKRRFVLLANQTVTEGIARYKRIHFTVWENYHRPFHAVNVFW